MLYRIEVKLFPYINDAIGHKVTKTIQQTLSFPIVSTQIVKVYTLEGFNEKDVEQLIKKCAFHDAILQEASMNSQTTTADFTGVFQQPKTREEFMNYIRCHR